MIVKTTPIPIYFGYFRIVICKHFQNAADKLEIDTSGFNVDNMGAFTYNDKNKKGIARHTIFIRKNATPSMIAHEAVHLTNAVFIGICAQLDRNNDEPQAYLTGWFVEQIHKVIKK